MKCQSWASSSSYICWRLGSMMLASNSRVGLWLSWRGINVVIVPLFKWSFKYLLFTHMEFNIEVIPENHKGLHTHNTYNFKEQYLSKSINIVNGIRILWCKSILFMTLNWMWDAPQASNCIHIVVWNSLEFLFQVCVSMHKTVTRTL